MTEAAKAITVTAGGRDYVVGEDNKTVLACVAALRHVEDELSRMSATVGALSRARQGYLEDLKSEIIRLRTGVEL